MPLCVAATQEGRESLGQGVAHRFPPWMKSSAELRPFAVPHMRLRGRRSTSDWLSIDSLAMLLCALAY
jgi:hypothetical protein